MKATLPINFFTIDENDDDTLQCDNSKDMNEIIRGLYLTGLHSIHNEKLMQDKTHIVQCMVVSKRGMPNASSHLQKFCLPPKQYEHIQYLKIDAKDEEDFPLQTYFDSAADFIHEALQNKNSKVVVHCQMGISRSTSVVIAYLLKYYGSYFDFDYANVLEYIQTRHRRADPNEGFKMQLYYYGKCLKHTQPNTSQEIRDETNTILTTTQVRQEEYNTDPSFLV